MDRHDRNDDTDHHPGDAIRMSRRAVLGAGAAAVPVGAMARQARRDDAGRSADRGHIDVAMKVNGKDVRLSLDPRTTLLDALREHLRLTGSKKGCDHGQCGACTVIVEGRRINACLTLAVMHDGDAVTTIEGLGTPERMHPMQRAFVTHDGYQCGYCTPGQICAAVAMLDEIEAGVPSHVTRDLEAVAFSDDEVRERMSGNICRCAAYPNIVAAIRDVQGEG
ncbi:aldehyde dehydrogenase iron-sulfur subunit PaoA [Sphingomonas sp.]